MITMPGKLEDYSGEDLFGTIPDKAEDLKDGILVETLRKAMQDHPAEAVGGSLPSTIWVAIMTGKCSPEKWECCFEILNDSGCLNLVTGEQLRLAPNLRFLFVMPDAGDTPTDVFSRSAVVWTDPVKEDAG